jgi:hypothetical protein
VARATLLGVPHTNFNATNCASARLPEDDAPDASERHGYRWTQHIGSHRGAALRLHLGHPDPVEPLFTGIRYPRNWCPMCSVIVFYLLGDPPLSVDLNEKKQTGFHTV